MHRNAERAGLTSGGAVLAWAGILLVMLALAAESHAAPDSGAFDRAAALQASEAAVGRRLRDRELVDQFGRPVRLSELRGRPLVLSFIFTNCTYACSALTLHLRDVVRIARDALGPDSFSVLTIGFDSPHDTPARMRDFARQRGITDPRWLFASGDAATIRRLTDEAGFSWTEAGPAGFDHVALVTLVDADGRVARQVYGQDPAPPELIEPLKQLVLERSRERSAVRGVIDGVRLFCTVYDPTAGRYRFDYSMVAGILPVLLVLGMAAIAIVVGSRKLR